MNAPSDNQDKAAWCEYGESAEREFLLTSINLGVGLMRNPEKSSNRFAADFLETCPCDLKTVRTQFHTADRYGVDPDFAVTLNVKDVERYRARYRRFGIWFDVDFPKHRGLHRAELFWILRMVEAKRWPVHEYQQRVEDTRGNAKASYVLDIRTVPQFA